jgi:glycine cleavage system H lipoate-binding protein
MTGTTERQSPTIFGAIVHPCLWMSAGLVSYKLCDRDFDCERCPLDAALGGESRPALSPPAGGDGAGSPTAPFLFPDDRRYGDGHTWAQRREPAGDGVARVGIDAFAAALAGPVRRLLPRTPPGARAEPGTLLAELELDAGTLPVASPVAGRLRAWNPRWDDGPGGPPHALAPYGDGWIAELVADDPSALDALTASGAAREGALLDLRRFRRRAALHLLAADAAGAGATLPDGGQVLTDLRAILGPRRYLELLRDLLA